MSMPVDDGVQPNTSQEVEDQGQDTAEGGNPAWDSVREKLDPVSFKLIEDDLRNFDTSARTRVETANKAIEPYQQFIDNDISVETLEAALNVFGQINSEPEKVHEVLTSFLQENGRLPQTAAEVAQVQEDIDEAGTAPQQYQPDPRLDRAMSFIEQQEQVQFESAINSQIEQEVSQVRLEHPEYSEKDLKAVSRLAALGTQEYINKGSNRLYTMIDAAQEYESMRQDLLSTPRPGNKAPQLVSPTAGVPSGQVEGKSLGQRTNSETIDLVAELLTRGKSQ